MAGEGPHEVVISGMSGRFPECCTLEEFKKKLFEKENLITVDDRKWPVGYTYGVEREMVPSGTGKFVDAARLDSVVFQMNQKLSSCYDTINRTVLEPAFEAVIDSGVNPSLLNGSQIGVYASFMISEGDGIKCNDRQEMKSMFLLGSSKTMVANRISFALDLRGPSFTVTSTFEGGLVALTMAYRDVVNGIVDGAIVVSSNNIVDPKLSIHYKRLGLLSPDGLCRAFDDLADGYGRSDGAVAIFLQRKELAKRIYGEILHSDTFYFGRNPHAFVKYDEKNLRTSFDEIYAKSKVKPSEVSFIEMHGCAVPWMDKVESNVVAEVFCRDRKDILYVGSVKSNVGNLEGASGLASIVKALIALDTDYIPPNNNFTTPNKRIKAFADNKLKVASEKMKLPGPVVAVNSFGLTGVVGHTVLKQNEKDKNSVKYEDEIPRLLFVFGRTEEGVKNAISKAESMEFDKEFIALANDVFKIPMYSQLYRGYTILPALTKTTNAVDAAGPKRPIWFIFSGMGSQWHGMGIDLLNIPIFAAAIDKIDAVMRPRNMDVRRILTSDDPTLFDNITNCFVGITSIQIGLVDMLRAIGIKPDGIIGHSVGETACAYADGCFTAEEAVLSCYSRGVSSLEKNTIKGLMASIGKGYEQIKDILPGDVQVACHNSSENCTISGPEAEVQEFVDKLKKDGIFAKVVNTANIAYHSKHVAPIAPLLLSRLQQIVQKKPRSPIWISSSVPESDWDTDLAKHNSAEYHANNFMNPVLFHEACKHIPENAIVIEIAPYGLLQAIVKRSLNSKCTNIPLYARSLAGNGIHGLLSSIGKLYLEGCQPDINALYPEVKYPVVRGTHGLAQLVSWNHTDDWGLVSPKVETPLSQEFIKVRLNKGTEYNFLEGHKIHDKCVIPPSFYMFFTWHMLSMNRREKVGESSIIFENIAIHENLTISLEEFRMLSVMIQHGSGTFQVCLENDEIGESTSVIMTGIIRVPYEKLKIAPNENNLADCGATTKYKIVNHSDFYGTLRNFGYNLDGIFNCVQQVSYNNSDCYAKIMWNGNWVSFLDSLIKTHVFTEEINRENEILFPDYILNLSICAEDFARLKPGDVILCHKDCITKRMLANGLEMFGCRYEPLKLDLSRDVNVGPIIEGMHFVPYLYPQCQDLDAFLEFCLKLIIECAVFSSTDDDKVYIENSYSGLMQEIKKIIRINKHFNSAFRSYIPNKVNKAIKLVNSGNYHLVVIGNVNELAKMENAKRDNLFVIAKLPDDEFLIEKYLGPFSVVTEQRFGEENIILFKKVENNYDKDARIIMANNKNWMADVLAAQVKSNKSKPIVLVWERNMQPDLSVLLLKAKNLSGVRSLFILDENAPAFSPDNPLFKNQLIQELPVAVLKDGSWGNYRAIRNSEKPFTQIDKLNVRIESVDIEYLSLDEECIVTDQNVDTECGFEYSGHTNLGKRVMGLSSGFATEKSLAKVDPYFTWVIPNTWTLEDAATVPYVYLQAYYMIFVVRKEGFLKSALVHCADRPFGEACLRLLLHDKWQICVTVSNEKNAKILKRKFSNISDDNIFLNTDCNYENKLKILTKGKGIDMIFNPLSDLEHRVSSVELINLYGNYFEFSHVSNTKNIDFNMHCFLKSMSFYSMVDKKSWLLDLTSESKQQLYTLVKEGIETGVVKPLDRVVHMHNQLNPNHLNFTKEKKMLLRYCPCVETENQKLRLDSNHSYIILDGGRKSTWWFGLMEWLIERGARKFVILVENFSVGSKVSHQISRFTVQKKASIFLTSTQRADTLQEAQSVIMDATNMAPLEAIFFASDCNMDRMHNMDIASRDVGTGCHYISLKGVGLSICEARRNAGFASAVINFPEKSNTKISTLLSHMETMLSRTANYNLPILIDFIDTKNQNTRDSSKVITFSDLLPSDFNSYASIGNQILPDEAYFLESPTLSPRLSETKSVFPVFIIPAIGEDQLKPMLRRLFYPAYYAVLPENFDSCSSVASQLAEKLQKIQPEGPITLIGECWNGCITIELGLQLASASGRKIRTFLIEGSPSIWQNALKNIGEVHTPSFDVNLLKELFYFMNDSYSNGSVKFDKLLTRYLRDVTNQVCKENIKKKIISLRNQFIALSKFDYSSGRKLEHVIHFKRRNTVPHNPLLEQYCLTDDVFVYDEEKYEDFIVNTHLVRFINDNAIPSWCFEKV